MLITGTLKVTVFGDGTNPQQIRQAVHPLPTIGQSLEVALPRPAPSLLAIVDKACGARPGEHGRR